MEDTQLYAILLGIKFPWRVTKVQVDMGMSRIDVWVEEAPWTESFAQLGASICPC